MRCPPRRRALRPPPPLARPPSPTTKCRRCILSRAQRIWREPGAQARMPAPYPTARTSTSCARQAPFSTTRTSPACRASRHRASPRRPRSTSAHEPIARRATLGSVREPVVIDIPPTQPIRVRAGRTIQRVQASRPRLRSMPRCPASSLRRLRRRSVPLRTTTAGRAATWTAAESTGIEVCSPQPIRGTRPWGRLGPGGARDRTAPRARVIPGARVVPEDRVEPGDWVVPGSQVVAGDRVVAGRTRGGWPGCICRGWWRGRVRRCRL